MNHECIQSQKTLKASHDTAMAKVDELTGQLKEERLRILGLENQLHTKALQERRTSEVLLEITHVLVDSEVMKDYRRLSLQMNLLHIFSIIS